MPSNAHLSIMNDLKDFDIIENEDGSGYLLYFSKNVLSRLNGFPIRPAPPPAGDAGGGPGFCVVATSDLNSPDDCGRRNLREYRITVQNVSKLYEGVSITCAGDNCFIFYERER
jgi:hypothetical protein